MTLMYVILENRSNALPLTTICSNYNCLVGMLHAGQHEFPIIRDLW